MLRSLREHTLRRALDYHISKRIPFTENVFRPHSEMSNALFAEAKYMYETGEYVTEDWFEKELLESDIGEYAIYEDRAVPLDIPLLEGEEEKVPLNKPRRGGPKKFYVYVKDPSTGNVKKVTFGDVTGLTAKINNPEARKQFAARHKCSDQTDKTSAAYWSCRLPYFAKSVGLSGGGSFFW